jgi:hypothetical protein
MSSKTPKKSHRQGYTLLDESVHTPLTSLDQLPALAGFSQQEIQKTLDENKVITIKGIQFQFLGSRATHSLG